MLNTVLRGALYTLNGIGGVAQWL